LDPRADDATRQERKTEMIRTKGRNEARTHSLQNQAWIGAVAAIGTLVAGLCFASADAAQMDVTEGKTLAEAWCSSCHIVAPTPRMQSAAPGSPPDFSAVAKAPTTTEQALTVFLETPHPPMPDFQMSRSQVSALVDYILSLRDR
jgi:mono/diheme cytochrome c family protein